MRGGITCLIGANIFRYLSIHLKKTELFVRSHCPSMGSCDNENHHFKSENVSPTKRMAVMTRILSSLFLAMILVITLGCSNQSELGTRQNPVKLYFTPSIDAEVIASNSREFIQFLEAETGLYFTTGIPTSYIAVVEALGSSRADIGVMNSFGYLMANERYGATARLKVIRHGVDYYQGQIIAHVDSGINSIQDLEGKRFAFTDPSSTSGYMFPLKILKENNITLGNTTFSTKHDAVVIMVYQRQVDAGSTYYSAPTADGTIRDARERVKTQFPDVEDKIKIIAITDPIANDPFVFRKDIPEDIANRFIAAIKKFIQTEQGQRIFKEIYSVEGIVDTDDSDYDSLRQTIISLGLNVLDLVK
jgi:phosphonate transport system substrate-binding protein